MVAPGSRRNQFWQSLAQISEMAEEVLHSIRTWITPLRPGRDGTDLLECKQPRLTVGSLFPTYKAAKPWEYPFTGLLIA